MATDVTGKLGNRYWIKNGYVIDPNTEREGYLDLLIENGKIAQIIENTTASEKDIATTGTLADEAEQLPALDATGKVVTAGLIDTHVHFRDPGQTAKEDILTGAAAAAAGGYTSVVMMGNTIPHPDNGDTIQYMLEKGARTGIHCYVCGNITKEMAGKELTDFDELIRAGAVLFTDDGVPVVNEELMTRACRESVRVHKILSLHEENPKFITENGINAGRAAQALGLTGSPREAEISMVERDIRLAKETGAELTIQHISTADAVEMIRKAKAEGVKLHAEATPHHFTLTDTVVEKYGTMAKMNPPLRTEPDRLAIIAGLKDGTIDMIATDHAPHTREEKSRPFAKAPSGIIGLETALSLGIRSLVKQGHLTLPELLHLMSASPARIYGLPGGRVAEGQPADLVIFDPEASHKVEGFVSKASNSPFIGMTLPGVIYDTICDGRIVYRRY